MVGIQMLVNHLLFNGVRLLLDQRGYEFALMWTLLCVAIWFRGGAATRWITTSARILKYESADTQRL